jgi:hypothetical protein
VRLNPLVRRIVLTVAVLSLLALSWNGVSGGMGQKVQTACQFAFGFFGLLSVVTTFIGRRWRTLSYTGWTVSITLAGGLAAVVWGDTSVAVGFLAGLASLGVALLLIWLLPLGARGLPGN